MSEIDPRIKEAIINDAVKHAALNDRQRQALDFTFAEHLHVKGELDQARQDIADLRERLAEAEVKLNGMDKLNDLYRDQLEIAITDRKVEADRSAKLAALLAVMHTAMHEAAIDDFTREPEADNDAVTK